MFEIVEKIIDEADYNQIKRKNKSINRLFPDRDDKVQGVADNGGVKLDSMEPNTWHFKVASGTDKGKSYDITYNFADLDALLAKVVKDKRLWNKERTKINLNKLAAVVLNKANVKLSCTCPSFKFHGFDYVVSKAKYDAKYGDPETRRPKVRNPKEYGSLCKHLQAVFKTLPFYRTDMAKYLKQYYNDEIKALETSARDEGDFFKAAGTALGKKIEQPKQAVKPKQPVEPEVEPEQPEEPDTKQVEPVVTREPKSVDTKLPSDEPVIPSKEEEPEPVVRSDTDRDAQEIAKHIEKALQDVPTEEPEPEELENVKDKEELLKKQRAEGDEEPEDEEKDRKVKEPTQESRISKGVYGTCQNEDLVKEIFGSVSEFARQIENNGDEFVYRGVRVIYDKATDIHTFLKEYIQEAKLLGSFQGIPLYGQLELPKMSNSSPIKEKKATPFAISSYMSDGLTVVSPTKRYTYNRPSSKVHARLKKLINAKAYGRGWQLLKSLKLVDSAVIESRLDEEMAYDVGGFIKPDGSITLLQGSEEHANVVKRWFLENDYDFSKLPQSLEDQFIKYLKLTKDVRFGVYGNNLLVNFVDKINSLQIDQVSRIFRKERIQEVYCDIYITRTKKREYERSRAWSEILKILQHFS